MEEKNVESRIIQLIDKIKPFLIQDGGNLEFIRYENHIVYVKLVGACADCPMMDITLKDGIEELLVNEIPEVEQVLNVSEN